MKALVLLAIGMSILYAAPARADLGTCYDGAIASCNLALDESENWGHARYRNCVKALLAECDAKHKSPQGEKFKAVPDAKPLSRKKG